MLEIELPKPESICSVIVSHNPADHLASLVTTLQDQTDHVILVDNHSTVEKRRLLVSMLSQRVEWIANDENRGIAAGLNQGFLAARLHGYPWVLAVDQDSTPEADMVQAYCTAFQSIERPERIAIMAPRLFDVQTGRWSAFLVKGFGPFYRRVHCADEAFMPVTSVITSGSLFNLKAIEELGGFREDFFIDYVDTEYCLRARKRGYMVIIACDAVLRHRLGRRQEVNVGFLRFFPTFHSPERWYYMGRNRIPMLKEYALRFPHWFTYEVTAGMYTLLRMLLTEDQRRIKLAGFFRGTWDGLRGKMGPIDEKAATAAQ